MNSFGKYLSNFFLNVSHHFFLLYLFQCFVTFAELAKYARWRCAGMMSSWLHLDVSLCLDCNLRETFVFVHMFLFCYCRLIGRVCSTNCGLSSNTFFVACTDCDLYLFLYLYGHVRCILPLAAETLQQVVQKIV